MDPELFKPLIARAKAGEDAAADTLFVAAFDPLSAEVVRLMDPILRSRLQPEDIVQEVYALAWPKLGEVDCENFVLFLGWLKTIARNKVNDLRDGLLADKRDVMREAGRPATANSAQTTIFDRIPSPKSTPSMGVARKEAIALMMARLSRLPEDYRQVLNLRFIQGLTVIEIAQRLNESEGAVHMRCSRALKRLGDQMGPRSEF